jgi:hypothetical protein
MSTHSEHLLEEEIIWNLQHAPTLSAQCREHQISVGNLSLQILGQNFDGLPKLKGSPEHKEEAGGKIAYHGPGGKEAHANNRYDADQNRPDTIKSDTPNAENGKCGKDPETSDRDALDCKIRLVAQMQPGDMTASAGEAD